MSVHHFLPRRLRVSLLFLFGLLPAAAAAQGWRWAQGAGGIGNDQATCLVVDSAGNQYIGGSFEGTATFGTTTLTSAGGADGFIAKLDSTGAWLWVQQVGSAGVDRMSRLRFDEHHGALLVLGTAPGATTLGPVTLPAGGPPAFVARLDAATGTAQWAQRADEVTDAVADAAGNVIVCGAFVGDSLALGAFSVVNASFDPAGEHDVYVGGLSPAGVWQWLESTGAGGDQLATSLVLDSTGAVYVGGSYYAHDIGVNDTVYFGPHELPYVVGVSYNFYLAKLNPARTWEWAFAGTNQDRAELTAVALDRQGTVYVAGLMNDIALLFGNDTILVNPIPSFQDVSFVACITPQGQVRWAAQSTTYSYALELLVAPDGRTYMMGRASGDSVQLGNYVLTCPTAFAGGEFGFVAALDSAGRWQWADTLEGSISVNRHRHLTQAGRFRGRATFGPFTLANPDPATTQVAVAQRGLPAFIHRFGPATGPAGTIVTLSGTGFAGTTAVFFGSVAATFTVLPNGQLQVTVPPGVPTTGPGVLIQVVGPNGSSLSLTRFGGSAVGLVAALTMPNFYLLPNPAHERAALIGLPAGAPTVQVLDALGRVVRTQPASAATLDLRGLAPGVYVVRAGAAARRLVVE